MTASLHTLGGGRDAGLYYVNDPNREARPYSRDEYYVRDGGGVWWSTGETIVRHGAEIDKETFRDLCAGLDPTTGKPLVRGCGTRPSGGLGRNIFRAEIFVSAVDGRRREPTRHAA